MTGVFPTGLVLLARLLVAPLPDEYDLPALLQNGKLTSFNRVASVQTSAGKRGIRLDEGAGEGIVWLNDVAFSSGTIDVDLRGQDVFQRSFVGVAFHAADDSTYDAVYFRPFNFHAKDSVRAIHAVQYISHPMWTWQKLREERNAQYEKAIRNAPDPNGWFHARIEVTATDVRVFVNGANEPSLTVRKISTRGSGKLGLWVGDGSGGEFANLRITRAAR
jgi:hypothetical protein